MSGFFCMRSKVAIVSLVAASEATAQWVTKSARAPEECARKAGKRLGSGLVARNRVAGRKYYPVGIEPELSDLACGQKAIIERGRLRRHGQSERRLAQILD